MFEKIKDNQKGFNFVPLKKKGITYAAPCI